jgi:CheY-like chemotaxis protein
MLVDYAMPDMSGTELVRLARARLPAIAAVFVTGNADPLTRGLGCSDVPILPKPYTAAALLNVVQSALAVRTSALSAAEAGYPVNAGD